jgi:hypothetical protein
MREISNIGFEIRKRLNQGHRVKKSRIDEYYSSTSNGSGIGVLHLALLLPGLCP